MAKEEQDLLKHNGKDNNNKQQNQREIGHHQPDDQEVDLENEYDGDFWIKQSNGLSWSSAMDAVSVERLIQRFRDNGELENEDPALLLLKQWPECKKYKENPEKLAGLEQKTKQAKKKRALFSVELALLAENDEVAAYLVRSMWHKRVQGLFYWRTEVNVTNPQPSFFSFKSIIENPNMRKSVIAVLDQMINPHWPHLPKRKDSYENEKEKEVVEGAWCTITDDPLDYHFYYHILDGDEGGRPPKVMLPGGYVQTENKYFSWRDKSCLHVLAKSRNMEALQHPVVRMLVKAKWKSYGHFFLSLQAALYVIFLLCLSYSLLSASTTVDPTQYGGEADSLRGFCEIFTLIMVVFYICEEINQMRLEGKSYFTEWMTLFDWSGLLLILCIIPSRYTQSKAQWLVASLAFLFNFLRIFKFSCLTRTTGLYTKTLAKIILHDVTRSIAVFIVIFFSFCGALSLSLCYSDENQQFSDFGDVLLSGFRALSEQRPIAYDYSNFNWLSILLMMAYMGIVIVILLNILIAQMSTTYTQAKKVARLEYDVDRILQLTRMERFPFLNLRVKYYKEGDWISEMKLAQDLLEFSEDRSPWESVEEKLNAIRDMMRKMVKQMRPGIG
ncbi:transient receptor potential cation channel subfamily V member 4-like isoform X3 [Pocillopora verrucosa]|uniref:transient receptor potential cation channel subfamily V member 4-like isoform X3 n=1 Tax=Pocillopora verrucosa TaxID=203993 RepID=UPI0033429481